MPQGRDPFEIKKLLEQQEEDRLSRLACLSASGLRRVDEQLEGHRQLFAQDADRVLHSKAYTRYIDKTQVFSMIDNDHITHRVLHVQLVSRVARTVGRFLGLNEDLIEAVALGHDIGHPPFGHEGERILSTICSEYGIPSFQHNIQSVRFLDRVEKDGKGWNLTLQVLDGILCHDGEVHTVELRPERGKDFTTLDREIEQKEKNIDCRLTPMTLEGCVVRLADTIAYIGRDLEDAIELGLIDRSEIPHTCGEVLGRTNGTIVYNLVNDLITTSMHVRDAATPGGTSDFIGLSGERAEALLELKRFNYERIYANETFQPDFVKIRKCYEQLFEYLYEQVANCPNRRQGTVLDGVSVEYMNSQGTVGVVRDYIAGMTDKYFLRKAREIGCEVPERICVPN